MERSARIKRHFDGTTARIEISKAKASDAGEYTCVATNVLGSTRSNCQVNERPLYVCELIICRSVSLRSSVTLFLQLSPQVTILDPRDSSIADKDAPRFLRLLPEESIVMENHCHEFQTVVTGRIV